MTAPRWHEMTLRIITPTFLGTFPPEAVGPNGARQTIPLPVPSLRGALAQWLRALAGAHIGNDLDALLSVESKVFGAARTGTSGGPSPIHLRGARINLTGYPLQHADFYTKYLLGPGLLGSPPSRYLREGTTVALRVKNTGDPVHADLFLAALWGLRTFGGLGARTRRGLGTLAITTAPELEGRHFDPSWLSRNSTDDLPEVLHSVQQVLTDLDITPRTPPTTDTPPRYPCFAEGHYTLGPDDELCTGTAGDALAEAGQWWRNFRHGGDRKHPGTHHTATYDTVADPFLSGGHPQGPLLAGALGLPIPYHDNHGPGGRTRSATAEVVVNGTPSRRASPIWLRITKSAATWKLRSFAFHSEWLPPEASLRIKSGPRSAPVQAPTPAQIRAEIDRWFVRPGNT
ncbi:RAMP superfamily CRISPR-associated protein [Actinomadura sp. NPDC023710]|uniref:RAMP superfamily CRISPR-associated protein n=1 Tax=Actinomadura sp. NPDC023710 TaxID=3158219 RepID=UPI0033DFDC02